MYGYVVPHKSELKMQDYVLYRAFYCGICKTTGKLYGQLPRFTTNYDMTFLSVLLHDFLTQDVEIKEENCICNPFKKKAIIVKNELMEKIAALNIILAYHKATDDVIDSGGVKKRIARRALKKSYKKAVNMLPKVNDIANSRYEALRELEKAGEESVDIVSHCFSSLLKDVVKEILGDKCNDNMAGLCYNIGKFVYLVDALDDVDEDFKKKRYNPLLAHYKNYANRTQFIEDNKVELQFMLAITVNRAIECFNLLKSEFTQSTDLMTNIVHVGLRKKVEEIFLSKKKLKPPKI